MTTPRQHRPVRGVLIAAVVVAVAGAAIVLVTSARRRDAAPLPPDVGTVDYVVDGDTIDVAIGGRTERVRLIGINTPEIAHAGDPTPAECFGPEAMTFLTDLLAEGTEVRLERDVVGRDDYDRLLAYVYVRADGEFVNEAIIAAGYARPMSIPPNTTYADRFVAAATAAERADLGLWGACAG